MLLFPVSDAESTGSGSTVQAGRKLGGDKAQDGVPVESESADVEISGGYKEERDSSGEEGSGSYEGNKSTLCVLCVYTCAAMQKMMAVSGVRVWS